MTAPSSTSTKPFNRLLLTGAAGGLGQILRDVGAIVDLIRELAEFENLTHLLQVTPEVVEHDQLDDEPRVR